MSAFEYTTITTLDWRGILIEIRYAPEHETSYGIAHLEIETLDPPKAALPITSSGYRSHFTHREVIDSDGGPAEFVSAWLETEAKGKGWIEAEAAARQLSFF